MLVWGAMEKYRKEREILEFNTQLHRWLTWILKTIKKSCLSVARAIRRRAGIFSIYTTLSPGRGPKIYFKSALAVAFIVLKFAVPPPPSTINYKVSKFGKASEVKLRKNFPIQIQQRNVHRDNVCVSRDHMREEQYFYTRNERR